ncbi:Hypothetical predicted protein [Marmota monax]|uniref:Uncharacterized protein n=1 Tax=Marmota monax TaxID=9995 RepID=A0A5E4D7S1_MARMO|nr:Hypothetical predicted protein [Marmota monax]
MARKGAGRGFVCSAERREGVTSRRRVGSTRAGGPPLLQPGCCRLRGRWTSGLAGPPAQLNQRSCLGWAWVAEWRTQKGRSCQAPAVRRSEAPAGDHVNLRIQDQAGPPRVTRSGKEKIH